MNADEPLSVYFELLQREPILTTSSIRLHQIQIDVISKTNTSPHEHLISYF